MNIHMYIYMMITNLLNKYHQNGRCFLATYVSLRECTYIRSKEENLVLSNLRHPQSFFSFQRSGWPETIASKNITLTVNRDGM